MICLNNICFFSIFDTQELRYVKNFTSLKAIIAALQSNDLYRLKRVWHSVAREKTQRFSELAAIFSEDNNEMNARSLLVKEGTAKTADWKPNRISSNGNKSPRHNGGHKHSVRNLSILIPFRERKLRISNQIWG